MSKTFYLNCPYFYSLHRFVSSTKNILASNGQYVGVSFVIPIEIDVQRHRFEVYTLISEIYDNVDMEWESQLCIK